MSGFAARRRGRLGLCAALTLTIAAGSCAPQRQWTENDGGVTRWIDVAGGRLKTRVYRSADPGAAPILVIVLHGDLPEPAPSYQYEFARTVADRTDGVVVAGVLRPGYRDPTGDQSSGDMGGAVADNYTPEVVDAVARAARDLATEHRASAIVMVGHSGGAAIAANLLGRHAAVAQGAVLVACGCDPTAWRAGRWAATGNRMFEGSTRSLLPLTLAAHVPPATIVRMVVGDADDVAPPAVSQAYAAALRSHGVQVSLTIVPGLGHNILFAPAVFHALGDVVTQLGAVMRSGGASLKLDTTSEGRHP